MMRFKRVARWSALLATTCVAVIGLVVPAAAAGTGTEASTAPVCTPADAWTEQVLVSAASDETVLVTAAWTETVLHPAVAAVSERVLSVWTGGARDGAPSATDPGWRPNEGVHNGRSFQQPDDVPFQIADGSGDWFLWTTVVVTPGQAAWTSTIEHPAVTQVVHHDAVYQTVTHPAVICPVSIPAPTYTDFCGTFKDGSDIATTPIQGVTYDGGAQLSADGSRWVIYATIEKGFSFVSGNGWTLASDGRAQFVLAFTNIPCDSSPVVVPVTLPVLRIVDACGSSNDSVVLPEITGVRFDGAQTSQVTADGYTWGTRATPLPGYQIVESAGWTLQADGTADSTQTFTDIPCEAVDPTLTPNPPQPSTPAPAPPQPQNPSQAVMTTSTPLAVVAAADDPPASVSRAVLASTGSDWRFPGVAGAFFVLLGISLIGLADRRGRVRRG